MSGGAEISRAVVLARGLGSRMRREAPGAALAAEQAAVADTGVKAMIPIGRPFLDYLLSALADAGFAEACLVIGPEHDVVRDHYAGAARPERIAVSFAVQERPLGTADAVLAAEAFAGGESFLVMNSDNYYPVEALSALRLAGEPALPGFHPDGLVRGNIPRERIARFALLDTDAEGYLTRIVEKPDPAELAAMAGAPYVSMNCWRFPPEIFAACRRISPSPRGELELPDAVRLATEELGVRFRVIPVNAPVLDLSSRGDVAEVAARLAGVEVRL